MFIAMSLDGYIADREGKVDWLAGQDGRAEKEDSYGAFEKGIDTVIMGWRTYRQVVTELSPERWVYDNLQSYVITHGEHPSDFPAADITFVQNSPCALVRELKKREGKDIWICGGADIVRQLMGEGLIDRYHISVIPTILGGGIPLFHAMEREIKLCLVVVKNCNGIVELVYERRQAGVKEREAGI